MRLPPTPALNAGPVVAYADGRAGAFETLQVMRQLVNAGKVNPRMRQAATNIVHFCPAKDELHEVRTLFEFVRDQVRYVKDINGVETLSTPEITLAGRVGDCDDKTVLLCTLLECVGYPTRFVMTGYYTPGDFEHVYCQAFVPAIGDWLDLDATEPQPMGYMPPDPITVFIEKV